MTDTATEVTTSDVDLSDFDDLWAEASAAETGESGSTETFEVTPEILTGTEGEETDSVDTNAVIPPVADKPVVATDEWDWSAHADKTVPVKIGDVEEPVTLSELRNGYLRQQDYTRKTQQVAQVRDLAQWAQDVQRGFEVDPQGMLQAFARAFKVDEASQADPLEGVDEDLRPVYEQNRMLQEQLQQVLAAQERYEQERVIEGVKRELGDLKGEFGESFDPRETIAIASQYNLPLREAHYLRQARVGNVASPPVATPAVDTNSAEVVEAATQAAEATRLAGKQLAQGSTGNRQFKASEIAVDDFNDIGELFKMVLDGSSS